jgi:hypothetical protein
MKTFEEKLEEIQFMLEHLELKIHRKVMEKTNEKELSFTYPN